MGGSKGGSSGSNSIDYAMQMQKLEAEQRAREEQAARDAADKQERLNAYNTGLANAVASARARARQRVSGLGLDYNNLGNVFDTAIASRQALVPYLDPDPGKYFADSLIEDTLNNARTDARTVATRAVNQTFTPGFEQNYFQPTADDALISSILGSQRGEAQAAVERARARGNLDPSGYAAALRTLDELDRAGNATAQRLGGAVLTSNQERLRGVGDTARSVAGGLDLGDEFNIGTYTKQRDALASDLSGRLEGDIRGALEGQQFFDLGKILGQGALVQGAVNPEVDFPAAVLGRRQQDTKPRGLVPTSGSVF